MNQISVLNREANYRLTVHPRQQQSFIKSRGRKPATSPPAKGKGAMSPPAKGRRAMSPPAKVKGPMGPPSNRKGNLGIGSEVSASTEDEEKTNAYDTNFEKMPADRGITQPDPDHEPVNKNEWLVGLAQERSSNSVETISDDYFREFQSRQTGSCRN